MDLVPSRNVIALIQSLVLSVAMFLEKNGVKIDPFAPIENLIGRLHNLS